MFDSLLRFVLKPLALKKLNRGVPFATTCGTVVEVMDNNQSRVSIQPRIELLNDKGHWQEGAIFTLAETASGTAMTSIFLPVILKCRPVVSNAEFITLCNTTSALYAVTKIAESEMVLLNKLKANKKVEFDVEVDVLEAATQKKVAQMKACWHVKLIN